MCAFSTEVRAVLDPVCARDHGARPRGERASGVSYTFRPKRLARRPEGFASSRFPTIVDAFGDPEGTRPLPHRIVFRRPPGCVRGDAGFVKIWGGEKTPLETRATRADVRPVARTDLVQFVGAISPFLAHRSQGAEKDCARLIPPFF